MTPEPVTPEPVTPELAAEVAPAAGVVLEVTAQRLAWEAGVFTAEGEVVLVLGPDRVTAAWARGDRAAVVLERGTWTRDGATLHFDRATVQVDTRDGELEGAVVEPCACADGRPAAVRFRAARVSVLRAEVAVVRGGVVDVFRVPLVPVPYWPVVLDPKRFRLTLPEVGYGEPGLSARLHGRLGLGDYWLEGGPAWRQDRGVRAELEVDGPVTADAEVGYDAVEQRARGAVAAEGGFAGDWTARPDRREGSGLGDRAAFEGAWLTDATYADDFGIGFVDRGVAYRDTRAVAQARGFRVEGWLPDDASAGLLGFARLRPEWARGGYAVAPWVGAGVDGRVPGLATPVAAEGNAVVATGVDARASATWGLVHAEASVDGALWAGADGLRDESTVGALARVEVPTWGDLAGGRVLAWPGLAARLRDEALAAGPQVRAQAVAGRTVLGATTFWPLGPELGWPELTVDATGERIGVHAEAREALQSLEARLTTDLGGGLGFVHAGDTWLGWGDVALRAGRLVSGLGATLDLAAEAADPWGLGPVALEAATLRLGYDDGCSSLLATGTLSPDRALPDVGVQVVLRR